MHLFLTYLYNNSWSVPSFYGLHLNLITILKNIIYLDLYFRVVAWASIFFSTGEGILFLLWFFSSILIKSCNVYHCVLYMCVWVCVWNVISVYVYLSFFNPILFFPFYLSSFFLSHTHLSFNIFKKLTYLPYFEQFILKD